MLWNATATKALASPRWKKFYSRILFCCNLTPKPNRWPLSISVETMTKTKWIRGMWAQSKLAAEKLSIAELFGRRMCSDRDSIGGTSERMKSALAEISSHRYVIIASCLFRRGHWLDRKEKFRIVECGEKRKKNKSLGSIKAAASQIALSGDTGVRKTALMKRRRGSSVAQKIYLLLEWQCSVLWGLFRSAQHLLKCPSSSVLYNRDLLST